MKTEKPRVRFCWECGRKLYGNHFIEKEYEGHKRIFHKQCYELLKDVKYLDWRGSPEDNAREFLHE